MDNKQLFTKYLLIPTWVNHPIVFSFLIGMSGLNVEPVGTVSTKSAVVAMHDDKDLILFEEGKLHVCNMKGVTKQSLHFSKADGEPVLMDISGHFVAVVCYKFEYFLF